jgi:hypothetical protein
MHITLRSLHHTNWQLASLAAPHITLRSLHHTNHSSLRSLSIAIIQLELESTGLEFI